MTTDLRITGELKSLSLKPGDALVLMCDAILSNDLAEKMKHMLNAEFPGRKVLVLQRGMSLGTINVMDALPQAVEASFKISGKVDDATARALATDWMHNHPGSFRPMT